MTNAAELEAVHLSDVSELIVNITEQGDLRQVFEALGVEWTWQTFELGTVTDEDGTATEWLTLNGASRKVVKLR